MLTRLRNRLVARHLLWRSRAACVVETADGPLVLLPGVLDPVATKVGAWLGGVMQAEVRPGERWIDMGCGSGVVGVDMARAGAAVTCVDVDAACVGSARLNATNLGLAVDAVQSDLFAAVRTEGVTGVVYNVPFWPGAPEGRPFGRAMYAGPGFEAIRRYRAEADRVGVPRVLVALSEAGAGHEDARAAFGPARVLRRERVGEEWLVVLEGVGAPSHRGR